jgi:two-component sensor histidine kinase
MDIAVPLGIIINEIVSNSLKYAFKGKNDRGIIQIKLNKQEPVEYSNRRSENEQEGQESPKYTPFILTVSDNGVGIPQSFNLENTGSLGIHLVTILVDQLGGELELKREHGTEFVIKFRVKE